MPAVAASILWIWIFNAHEGILNTLLGRVGIAGPAWLQNKYWAKPALILMTLWGAGSGMIVWLAGLKGIPKHLYEADGFYQAGRFDLAIKRYEQVLNIDRYNIAARKGMEQVNLAKAKYYGAAYNETRGRLLWLVRPWRVTANSCIPQTDFPMRAP